jgi:hypothetical protein
MKHAVLTAVAALLIAIPTVANAEAYPPNIQKAFMSGCENSYTKALTKKGFASKVNTAKPMCSCMLNKISEQMSLSEFEEASVGLMNKQAGKPLNASVQKRVDTFGTITNTVATQCVKQIKM